MRGKPNRISESCPANRVIPRTCSPRSANTIRPQVPGAVTVTGSLVLAVYAISQAPSVGWTAPRTLVLPTATTGLAWLTCGLTGVALAGPAQILVTRASVGMVMAAGMTLTAAGILWAARVPVHGSFWADLAGPFFLTGSLTWVFIPVSIGALVGVTERDAGVASGLIDSSQQLGGAIGIAVASTVAAARSRGLLGHGHAAADALTGGFQQALWVCGLIGLAAVPVALLLVRRVTETGS